MLMREEMKLSRKQYEMFMNSYFKWNLNINTAEKNLFSVFNDTNKTK